MGRSGSFGVVGSVVLGVAFVVAVKVLVGVLYGCESEEFSNPVSFGFVVYDEVNGTVVEVESVFFEGFLVSGRAGDGRVYLNPG